MRDPAVDVTVKTRFAEASALLQVVSAGIERGALRLPGRLPCGRTFEIALLTASGELAIRGTAEAIRVDGEATLVRFLSASDDGENRDAWVDLDDAVVTMSSAMAAHGGLRPRLRDRGDWVGAHGTPTPTSVPLPTPRGAAPPIPPLPPPRPRAAASPSELPALAPPVRGAVGSMPLPRVDVAPPEVAPPAPMVGGDAPPPIAASAAPELPPSPPGTTAPPPMMAMWPGPTGYYLAPAPFDPQARLRPTTLPPGWGADQGRMWIPVVDPAAMPVVAAPAPAAPSVAPAPPTRAARGLLAASIVIAAAGAAVAVSAVWWARSVSAQRAAPPAIAAAPAVAGASVAAAGVSAPAASPASPASGGAAVLPAAAPAPVARTPDVAPPPAPAPSEAVPVESPAPAPSEAAPIESPAPAPAVAAPAVVPPASARCRLAITTNADRVAIFVDGRLRGQAPTTLDVPCHGELALRHPRYQEQVRTLALAGDDALHVVLARPRAQLRVVTRPAGATVKLGGRVVGRTPLTAPVDGFERASVTLSAPGYATETRAAYVKGGTTVLAVTLKRP